MKSRFFPVFLLVPLMVAGAVACSSSDSEHQSVSDDSDVDDLAGKADGYTKPIGTYELTSPSDWGGYDFVRLVLKTDRTFHYEKPGMCSQHPCDPIGVD